jgi:hypothetical protein
MEEVTLDNMKARLKELGFTESRIAKAIADAIERSKTSGAVYLYRKDYHSAVIQMDNGSGFHRWFMQGGEEDGIEDI